MKKMLSLILVCLILASICGCAQPPADTTPTEPGFGEAFHIESLRVVTDISRVDKYVKTSLAGSKVTVSDDAALTVTLTVDPEMPESDYSYRVESPSSVTVHGGSDAAASDGLIAFFDHYVLISNPRTNVGVHMEYTDLSRSEESSGIPDWTLMWRSSRLIADGVTYEERLYQDENAKPHKAYIVYADPSTTTIHYGTAQDGYTSTPQVRQNVLQQVQASVGNGYDVIAAVNGDFFAIEGDYHPTGLAIKNGQKLNTRQVGAKPYTAVTKDGEYIIQPLYFSSDKVDHIQNAISGNYAIVVNGKPHMTAMDTEMGYTSHPRTFAGLTKEGTLILAVIDGRQPKLSNGATLEKAAHFMISLGADKAINHDGGGSSTMILRNLDNYHVMNSPSDGSLRKVFGSIQIVRKQPAETP